MSAPLLSRPSNPLRAGVSFEPDGQVVVSHRPHLRRYAQLADGLSVLDVSVAVDRTVPYLLGDFASASGLSTVLVLTASRRFSPASLRGVVGGCFEWGWLSDLESRSAKLIAALWDHLPRVGPQVAHSFSHNALFGADVVVPKEPDCPNPAAHLPHRQLSPALVRCPFAGFS